MHRIAFVLQNESQRLERSVILEWNDTGSYTKHLAHGKNTYLSISLANEVTKNYKPCKCSKAYHFSRFSFPQLLFCNIIHRDF